MVSTPLPATAVDEVRVTIITDNVVDMLMGGSSVAHRLRMGTNPFEGPQPMAEHGFSVVVEARVGEKRGKVMFDTGVSERGLLNNLDILQVNAKDLQAIVLSHGHADHALGLPGLVSRLGSRGVPLVLHPDAYLERRLVLPNGAKVNLPPPRISDLRKESVEVIEEVGPSMLVDGMLLVSGEVARRTEFETGFPAHHAIRGGKLTPDPLIMDDQCLIAHVRGKGLVVVTGCGHAGIINIVRNAQHLTGVQQIYAIIGGFHLSGPVFDPRIPATVAALQEINPTYIVPGHCTGWVATHAIARAMPEAFLANSVGTTYVL